MRKIGLQFLAGHFSSACSNRSRILSNFLSLPTPAPFVATTVYVHVVPGSTSTSVATVTGPVAPTRTTSSSAGETVTAAAATPFLVGVIV